MGKFELASWLSGAEKTLVRRTLQGLQAKLNSCIRFVESSSGDRIFVKNNGGGCWSSVGHQEKTYQELSLQSGGCMHAGIIEHEFLHAIGLYHHQSRSDRDYYVKIIWGNIPEKVRHNFNKYSSTVVNHFNLPYDFQSVMHYGGADFGNGRTTIQTLDPTKQNVIGQRNGVSAGDIELLKKMYTCEANTGIGCPDDWKFCKNQICQKGQGDCDRDSECAGDLVCGEDNCREFHQGAKRTADCCTEPDDGGTDECAYTARTPTARLGQRRDIALIQGMVLICPRIARHLASAHPPTAAKRLESTTRRGWARGLSLESNPGNGVRSSASMTPTAGSGCGTTRGPGCTPSTARSWRPTATRRTTRTQLPDQRLAPKIQYSNPNPLHINWNNFIKNIFFAG